MLSYNRKYFLARIYCIQVSNMTMPLFGVFFLLALEVRADPVLWANSTSFKSSSSQPDAVNTTNSFSNLESSKITRSVRASALTPVGGFHSSSLLNGPSALILASGFQTSSPLNSISTSQHSMGAVPGEITYSTIAPVTQNPGNRRNRHHQVPMSTPLDLLL